MVLEDCVHPSQEELSKRNRALIRLLDTWKHEDPEEQKQTLEYLKRVLDEDRFSYRKLFPRELVVE